MDEKVLILKYLTEFKKLNETMIDLLGALSYIAKQLAVTNYIRRDESTPYGRAQTDFIEETEIETFEDSIRNCTNCALKDKTTNGNPWCMGKEDIIPRPKRTRCSNHSYLEHEESTK